MIPYILKNEKHSPASRRLLLLLVFLFSSFLLFPCDDTTTYHVHVHFIYGSKPHKDHRDVESHWFGGIHGGHVKLETNEFIVGFNPTDRLHIFSHKKKLHGGFLNEYKPNMHLKVTSFKIPLTKNQYFKLQTIVYDYMTKSPYDYAFFGMRCAAAAYDLLSQIGILEHHSKCWMVWNIFYPKLLRTRLFKLAEENDSIEIIRTQGYERRKWEKDKKDFRYPYPEAG